MQILSKVRERTSLWTLIFAFTFAVQVYRFALADMIIFGALTILLAVESSGKTENWKFNGVQVNQLFATIFTAVAGIFVFTQKRQSVELAIFFIFLAVVLFLAIWRKKPHADKLSKREFAHAIYWSIVAVILGAWEFLALIFSRIVHDDKAFPTISELLLPKLDQNIPRLIFLIGWLGVGYYCIEKWDQNE